MRNSLLSVRLRLAGRRAALLSLLLMLWVIPTVSTSATAPAMTPTAKTAPAAPAADPCEQLDKDTAAYRYCKDGATSDSDSDSGSGSSGSATQTKDKDDEDPCEYLKDTPGYDYCVEDQRDPDGGGSLESPMGNGCKDAPPVEAPGQGILGFLDPGPVQAPAARNPAAANADAYIYEQYGYAGLKWNTYDLSCGVTGVLERAGASNDNWFANKVFTWSKAWTALTVALRQSATDDGLFGSLDPAIERATQAVRSAVYSPWISVSLLLLGTVIVYQARKRNLPDVMSQIAWALLVMTAATGVANYPVEASKFADTAINSTISAIDQAFASAAPDDSGPAAGSTGGTAGVSPASYVAAQDTGEDTGQDTAHGNMLVRNVLFNAWLRGELGDDTSPVARKYGMELFDAQALTWRENRLPDEERMVVIKEKQTKFKEIAAKIEKEDPTAYAHLTGQESGRLGAATISNFQAGASNLFSMAADLVIVTGKWLLRLIVIMFPALAVIGLHRRTSGMVKTSFEGTMAAVINIPVFAAGGALNVLLVTEISNPELDLPGWLKVVMMGAISYALWKMLRPLTRLSAMINPNHNYLADAGGALTGPGRMVKGYAKYYLGTRYLRRMLGRQGDAPEEIAEEPGGAAGAAGDRMGGGRGGGYWADSDNWPYSRSSGGNGPSSPTGGDDSGGMSMYTGYEPDQDEAASYGWARGRYTPAGSLPAAEDVWDTEGWFVEDLDASNADGRTLTAGAAPSSRGRSSGAGSRPATPFVPDGPAPLPSGDGSGGAVAALPPGADVPAPRTVRGGAAAQGTPGAMPDGEMPPVADTPEGSRPTAIPESAEPRVIPPTPTDDGGTVFVVFDPDRGYTLRDERDETDEDGGER